MHSSRSFLSPIPFSAFIFLLSTPVSSRPIVFVCRRPIYIWFGSLRLERDKRLDFWMMLEIMGMSCSSGYLLVPFSIVIFLFLLQTLG
jgi:hypothetical protein